MERTEGICASSPTSWSMRALTSCWATDRTCCAGWRSTTTVSSPIHWATSPPTAFNLSGNLGVGAVLEVVMDADGRFVTGKVLPTKQEGEGVAVQDAGGKAIDLIRMLSADDFPGTAVKVAQDGGLAR